MLKYSCRRSPPLSVGNTIKTPFCQRQSSFPFHSNRNIGINNRKLYLEYSFRLKPSTSKYSTVKSSKISSSSKVEAKAVFGDRIKSSSSRINDINDDLSQKYSIGTIKTQVRRFSKNYYLLMPDEDDGFNRQTPFESNLIIHYLIPIAFAAAISFISFSIAKRKRQKAGRHRKSYSWNELYAVIFIINLVVFLGWNYGAQFPLVGIILAKYFIHNPHNRFPGWIPFSLLGSMFSHIGIMHFAFNMIALYSFGNGIYQLMPSTSHFVATYLTFGVWASLFSHVLRLVLNKPAAFLGASGALYGIMTLSAFYFPDSSVQLIFLPFFDINVQIGWLGLLLFDVMGALSNLTSLDHFGHLGGALAALVWLMMFDPKRIDIFKRKLSRRISSLV